MGYQDKIAGAFSGYKRKLFDYTIDISGVETKAVRLKVTENKYYDEDIEIINNDLITLKLNFPSEVPLYRDRNTSQEQIDESTGLFLYDVLPIEGFSKFEDNIEFGDILIWKIYDENANSIKKVFRVSEVLGNIGNKYLIWKKFYCSPYNLILTSAMETIIDSY